jgi:hypothetical protein
MAKQFVGREEILGLEEILGGEKILGGVGSQNFVGRQEILGLEEILGNAALEEIVSSGTFVDGDELEQAREGGSAEKRALARRLGRSASCGYNSHWAHIRGESPSKKSAPKSADVDPAVRKKALDAIRPIAERKASAVLAAYQKDGTVSDHTKKCIALLDKVEAGDADAKSRYQRRRAKALSGSSHKSMDYWADLYASAQLRKLLKQKGVKLSGDDSEDGHRKARAILDAAANASPKQIAKSDLKRAIDLWAGPQATKEEKVAVGAKMMAFLDKRKIKLGA